MVKILLVEDDRSIISKLTDFLQSEGFQVSSVTGQAAALELLGKEAFDLALLDISISDGNGFSRGSEFGVLISVGMRRREFRAMINYECLLYGFRALVWGIPISGLTALLIQYLVYSGVTRAITVPWGAMLIAAVSVFCVVFASMLYAVRKAEKDNPIDALRNENL